MAKLAVNSAAGWNAGKNFYAKTVRTGDIRTDPEISNVFKYKEHVLKEIVESIRRGGYDKSQPIAVWENQGELWVLDGHTRLAAAAAAGLDEVPVVVMDFVDKEDAILYTFERQVVRRNLEPGEIIFAVKLMMTRPGHKKHDGTGRSAEKLAARLGVSAGYVYQTKKVLEEAPAETISAVESGEKSIKEAYTEITKPRTEARKAAEKRDAESVGEFDLNESKPDTSAAPTVAAASALAVVSVEKESDKGEKLIVLCNVHEIEECIEIVEDVQNLVWNQAANDAQDDIHEKLDKLSCILRNCYSGIANNP